MLVATPGQTASYSLHSSAAPKKSYHVATSSSATPKSASNSLSGAHKAPHHPIIEPLSESSSLASAFKANKAATALMKTLTVRLNRSTELIKGNLQKALATAKSGTATTTTTSTTNNTGNISVKSTTVATAAATTTGSGTSTAGAALSSSSASARPTSSVSRLIAPSTSFLKLYTVPPTITHRYPQERSRAGSTDSLHKEMCHFKPIRSVPTTPWKCGSKSRGGAYLKTPTANRSSAIENVNLVSDEDEEDEEEDASQSSGNLGPRPSSTQLTTIISSPSHQSAFVCLVAQMKNLVNRPVKKMQSSKVTNVHKTINKRAKPPNTILTQKVHLQQLPRSTKQKQKEELQAQLQTPPQAQKSRRLGPKLSLSQTIVQPLLLSNSKKTLVKVKKLHMSAELLLKQSQLVTATTSGGEVRNKRSRRQIASSEKTTAKSLPIVPIAKSRATKGKTKVINIMALAHSNTASSPCLSDNNKVIVKEVPRQRRLRKRKISLDLADLPELNNVHAGLSMQARSRKSARLSKDSLNNNNEVIKIESTTKSGSSTSGIVNNRREMRQNKHLSCRSFSPPLTRSRLKELQRKLSASSQQQQQHYHQMLA